MFTKRDEQFDNGDGILKYKPDYHWNDAIQVYYHSGPVAPWRRDQPRVEINWGCHGSVSIEQAEQFVTAFQQAIADAKAKLIESDSQYAARREEDAR